jgi:plastocyanin
MVRRLGLPLVVSLSLLAACGSDEPATETEAAGNGAGTSTTVAPVELPATSSTSPTPAEPGTVEIVDFRFSPREIAAGVGETVTWRNEDPYAHWVVSTEADVLDSGEMSQAQTYSTSFSRPGTYDYYCNIHNYMKATVIVR